MFRCKGTLLWVTGRKRNEVENRDSADKGASASRLHLCNPCSAPCLISGTTLQNQQQGKERRGYIGWCLSISHHPSKPSLQMLTPLCHAAPPGIPGTARTSGGCGNTARLLSISPSQDPLASCWITTISQLSAEAIRGDHGQTENMPPQPR